MNAVTRFASALALALLVSGCAAGLQSPVQLPERRTTSFDFTPYLERGFLFTPAAYEGPYEARGFVVHSVRQSPADLVRRMAEGRSGASADGRVSALLDAVYEAAVALGADAVVQLTIEVTSDNAGQATYHLTGFAIRRTAS